MPVDYDALMALQLPEWRFSYGDKDVLLYNLSIGMGRDPTNPRELPFVFEHPQLRALPTVASILGGGSGARLLRDVDLDWQKVLHGEQRLTVHRPIPPAGELIGTAFIAEVTDKGIDNGATVTLKSEIRLASGERLYTNENTMFARGDGGCGGPRKSRLPRHSPPAREADLVHVTETRSDQALLYRLNADRNPLHADPDFAERAGFPRPILHGLCSYGIACRAVLTSVCDYDEARIGSFDCRFTAPVFPGETIHTDIWIDEDVVSFRCRVEARSIVSIDNGRCRLVA
jgi:acyl dehydratase